MAKVKAGEEGLPVIEGAEFTALETTEEAGMCFAFRSILGLVGSSRRMGRTVNQWNRGRTEQSS